MRVERMTLLLCLLLSVPAFSQTLTLQDAVDRALNNYGSIKAKEKYQQASEATVQERKKDYLPDVRLSGQQSYGTINGQHGPLYGFGGLGVASTALPLPEQDWNAAFGALYLANVNWDFFSFGRVKSSIKVAQSEAAVSQQALEQEQFEHQVKVAAAYLNLLTAQRIAYTKAENLKRAQVFKSTAAVLARSGLIAGVDSSLANAEVSNARIEQLKARDMELEKSKTLAVLMGVPYAEFTLDSTFVTSIPVALLTEPSPVEETHPALQFQLSRIARSDAEAKLYRKMAYPTFSLFGIVQGRGTGFQSIYPQDQSAFSSNYFDGVGIGRGNYLAGVGLHWNLTSISRLNSRIKSQELRSQALKDEYEVAYQELEAQARLADAKIANALESYREAPVQVKAASDAYRQHTALYKNGLTTIVDVTQSLYTLSRAEAENEIAYANVWQSLLLKAAATGDFNLFMDEVKAE
ncbi:TolC family protein [Pontibacter sp. FD36]|uniref:TolC family protein n=1 Tax=Pontibacter sp. FD36 TaxID=2789860 RepID=UPI0018AC1A2C|nr:TolC family protein [Pontibacter sp. FD36]MBF8961706.1 TolC family protein [Pontibacter sp. FD36]